MKLSREPVVWRTALAGVLSAIVTVGVLAQPAADQVSGALDALLIAANALLPVIAGVLARGKVAPTTATEPVQALIRGADGIYRPTGRLVSDDR